MTVTVAIAMSGGIDSLVAAALLKDQGYAVFGLHFLSGYESGDACPDVRPDSPTFASIDAYARAKMHPLAEQLDIDIHIIDLRAQFQKQVVDYFIKVYRSGKTPNPCLVCNPLIKFDVLLELARKRGADLIATGHYARIVDAADGSRRLHRGVDQAKDQSYFLAWLTQDQLAAAMLPLGGITKAQTRRIARTKGLIPASALESQDICFIRNGTYADFIARQPGFSFRPGPIEDLEGRMLGNHRGLHRFTIGQRRGINCPAVEAYYVVRIEPERNCLVVGRKQDLLTSTCRVHHVNWIASPPRHPIQALSRVRYRHKAVSSVVSPLDETRVRVDFDSPESAVTPGQGAVFYQGEEVLGGGWIE